MEQSIQVFSNPEFGKIRTLEINGEIFFVGVDVCNALGYQNPRDAIRKHVDSEDVAKRDTLSNGGIQSTTVINESGLYSLILSSKLPTAKKFKRWVTSEVLPSIRKHGFYIDPKREIDPDVVINLCNQIKAQRKKLELALEDNHILEQQVHELAPKATYYDLILNCKALVSVSEIAKDCGITEARLNEILMGYTGSRTHKSRGILPIIEGKKA